MMNDLMTYKCDNEFPLHEKELAESALQAEYFYDCFCVSFCVEKGTLSVDYFPYFSNS